MAIEQTQKNLANLANMETAVTVAAVFAGFMASEVMRAIIDPRFNVPDEAYGIVAIVVVSVLGAYGLPRWKGMALGAGFNSLDELLSRFNVQGRITSMAEGV